ncbi:hypothetical protein CJ030_MR6G013199 [Morella rubra]|uniref:Uncharacterized protein n=1 Tax=Morella rubra TaxID=262757 RepID=A0A6A1VAD0_9ROSI|nr:hypothetical protein CJ030_MR6G013199 [Morella rubra]
MHNIFPGFPTKEAALADPSEEMHGETWKIMCDQWEEKGYKVKHMNICQRNAINRRELKVPHISNSKSLQNLRVEQEETMSLFAERDPLQSNLELAEEVFHEVLGHKSGHVKGLGLSTIPKPSRTSRSYHVTHLAKQGQIAQGVQEDQEVTSS